MFVHRDRIAFSPRSYSTLASLPRVITALAPSSVSPSEVAEASAPTRPNTRITSRPSSHPFLRWVGLIVVLAVNAILITSFYDHSWMPSDDGHYLHVADRLADGQVLNLDVEEMHPGYVHFIHSWALQIFGRDVVSLRFPIMALVALQSVGTYAIFRRTGVVVATTAAVVMAGIGAFQISDPTPSLYALTTTVAIAGLTLSTSPSRRYGFFRTSFSRCIAIGVLVGVLFLFRQLTAVFVVMGLLSYLFTEQRSDKPRRFPRGSRLVAQAVLLFALVGLIGYLFLTVGVAEGILFGFWPVLLLSWATANPTASNYEANRILSGLGIGAIVAALPLLGYHFVNDSLGVWANDTFVRALSVSSLEHIQTGSYLNDMAFPALGNLLTLPGPLEALNGLYWLALVTMAFIAGWITFARLRHFDSGLPSGAALPFLAVFHGLVAVFNQIPFYLYVTVGLSLIAVVWMSWHEHVRNGSRQIVGVVAGALLLVAVAVYSHAGQPHTRSGDDVIAGVRAETVASEIPRFSLTIDPAENQRLTELVSVIHDHAQPGDPVFAYPNDAAIYFLSERPNPFRLFNPTISIHDNDELIVFVGEFDRKQPEVVVHNTASIYNNEMISELSRLILDDYRLVASIDEFDVYARR